MHTVVSRCRIKSSLVSSLTAIRRYTSFLKCLNNPCEKTHVVLGCHCLRHQKCKTVQTAHTLC